jgi:hypothetical protein
VIVAGRKRIRAAGDELLEEELGGCQRRQRNVRRMKMGMPFRLFAPSSAKKARRAMHPVSAATPRPVRKAKARATDIANPAAGVRRAGKRRAVRSVRSSKWF